MGGELACWVVGHPDCSRSPLTDPCPNTRLRNHVDFRGLLFYNYFDPRCQEWSFVSNKLRKRPDKCRPYVLRSYTLFLMLGVIFLSQFHQAYPGPHTRGLLFCHAIHLIWQSLCLLGRGLVHF